MNKVTLLQGHVIDRLRELPENSVHMVCTSPPYWGLRDYGCEGQIGLEKTIEEYVAKMVEVFREVRRVLRKDGVFFLDLGDSYSSGGRNSYASDSKLPNREHTFRPGSGRADGIVDERGQRNRNGTPNSPGLKPKDLCGIPWRVALALQADGWWLRSDIIWAKPNPMPESVTDRPTRSHEYIFLLTKSAKYFWDQEAVREPNINPERTNYKPGKEAYSNGNVHGPGDNRARRNDGFQAYAEGKTCNGRNLRSVWTIATAPFPEAHFATFPPALVEKCIKAGTSEKGVCPKCGAPWVRIVEKTGASNKDNEVISDYDVPGLSKGSAPDRVRRLSGSTYQHINKGTNVFKSSCLCDVEITDGYFYQIPATVLDPFSGSGTTSLVAAKLGRDSIGIELKPEYVEMAKKRLRKELGFLVQVTTADGADKRRRRGVMDLLEEE